MEEIKFYRYESVRYSVTIDADMEIYGVSDPKLVCTEYRLHSETPKGYWIGSVMFRSKDTWVSKTSRKRFAHMDKKEALDSYIKRKKAYVRHSEVRLKRAQQDLAIGLVVDIL